MRVIKRNGAEVEFDIVKIIAAVTKANNVVDEEARMTPVQIQRCLLYTSPSPRDCS